MSCHRIFPIALVILMLFVPKASADMEREITPDWNIKLPGEAMDITTDGNYLYIACNGSGLLIVSRQTHNIIGQLDTTGLTFGVSVKGDYVYLADWDKGLKVINVSEPSEPKLVGNLDTPGSSYKVVSSKDTDTVYLCDWDKGFAIIDVSVPEQPELKGRFEELDHATDCRVVENLAYIVDWWGLHIVDISNPASIIEISNLSTPGNAYGVDISGNYAYVADDHMGLRIISIRNKKHLYEISHIIADTVTVHVCVLGSLAFTANHNGGVMALDISEKNNPEVIDSYNYTGIVRRIYVYGNNLYYAGGKAGITAMKIESNKTQETPWTGICIFFGLIITIIGIAAIKMKKSNKYYQKPVKQFYKLPAFSNGRQEQRGFPNQQRESTSTPQGGTSAHYMHSPESYPTAQPGSSIPVTPRDSTGQRVIQGQVRRQFPKKPPSSMENSIPIKPGSILAAYIERKGISINTPNRIAVRLIKEAIEHDITQNLSPEPLFELYLAMRQLSYRLYPKNEWLSDLFHNQREQLTFDSYFDIPFSGFHLLHHFDLPLGLQSNLHLDDQRKEIKMAIKNSSPNKNFVILGEPGVGKTALLYRIFDEMMVIRNPAILTGEHIGGYHEQNSITLFVDDIPRRYGLRKTITDNNVNGIIATAREKDWEKLPSVFRERFHSFTLKRFSSIETGPLVKKLLKVASITSEHEAVKLLGEYSQGSPVFIWTLISQLQKSGRKHLTTSFIESNTSRGMLNYLGDILTKKFRDKENYREGGFHALAMFFFLAEHMEERKCSTGYFLRIADKVAENLKSWAGTGGKGKSDHGLLLSNLTVEGGFVRFQHDYWADLVLGNGERNPFSADIAVIRKKLSDTGVFEEAKRAALSVTWEIVMERYRKKPTGVKEGLLAFADTVLSNFTISEISKQGIDIERIREIAALYSHLEVGEKVVSKLERVSPRPSGNTIEIRDSVVFKSNIG